MERIENLIRETYRHGECIIEISETEDSYDAYIGRPTYGDKHFMFGCPKEQQTMEEFVSLVSLNADRYANFYEEEKED